ncbi:penicillin-binding protein activator [Legionella spiritensis]|nr:penicillin-binding protein activator [Legionella spiritensis]
MSEHHTTAVRKAATPYTMPTAAYLAMAKNQIGEEQQNMLIMAAGRALYDGQWREALSILAQTRDLSPVQKNEKNILMARIDLLREQPRAAIARLSAVRNRENLPEFYQVLYHEQLASAYEASGNASYAVAERIKLERLLPDEASRINNRRVLWLTLTRLPDAELNTMGVEASDGSELQGWMKLALVARRQSGQPDAMLTQVAQWQEEFPGHPANKLLPSSLSAVKPYLYPKPRHMALLLPVTGPLAGPGGAVRDGFMAAYNASNPNSQTSVRIYNTAAGDVTRLYQQALEDGADYVVGPLAKNDVAIVASMSHPVPTLLLNDNEVRTGSNAYRFSLSPANEARQVAAKAGKKGLKHVLIIAPSGSWGDEIVAAFTDQWQAGGGMVIDRLAFDDHTDLNTAVRELLHVSESEAKEKQFRRGAEPDGVFVPKRRQDFDMIFLLAYPSKARQIMPLLKYYFAGDVPVYATSAVYAGNTNTMRDRDLDGIIFCDMPWVFNHQLANKNWPEQLNSYNRLYALGMDSYALTTQLNQLILFPAMGINDKSGVLYLNRAQQVARILAWGKFKGGVAELTSETI